MLDLKLDNSPNARKLLDSLRYLGYDNLHAIADIVDNAIDADAQNIYITVERTDDADFVIQIADDGIGMTSAVLDQASRLGSDTPHNRASDLGRFGMGLVTASLSIGRRLTIITRTHGGEMLTNLTDYDRMVEENQFVKEYFGPATAAEKALFEEALDDASSGTIIRITKCDGFKQKYLRSFEKHLGQHIGQVYRMFIRAGRNFFVNGEEVEVHDPLWFDDKETEIHSDEPYVLKYTSPDGEEVESQVRVRLVMLPDHGDPISNRKAGYNVQKSGIYVLRNNREIAEAQMLGLSALSRHPDFIRFRGELFISGDLDEAMGVEFTKRDIKPTQSIRDQLNDYVGGDIKTIRNLLKKKAVKADSEGLDHSSSERLIDLKSALLIKPRPRNEDGAGSEPRGDTPLGAVKFRVGSFGREGPLYGVEQRGKTVFIDWNADHPFYERFLIANREDRQALNAVDAMVFSMAVAELKVFDDDHQDFIESWKAIFSSNLRILLS